MTKSIETMWKEGFVNETQLTAPKVNDLYNRKSQNIVDKLLNMFAINIKMLVIGSVLMVLGMSLIGAPLFGIYVCILLVPLIVIAKKELKRSVDISKGQSSYDYLINFDNWLKHSIETYARYYRIFYPLFFLGMATRAVISKAGGKIIALLMEKFPTDVVILGLPYYLFMALACIGFIIVKYADALYRLDLNIVYGRQFKKLDELIKDMKSLRRTP